MKGFNSDTNSGSALRYGILVPLAFMIASVITCCFSYSDAKRNIANDLNDAIYALANENCELWTRPETIAAIRHMDETTHKPMIFQASDINFRNPLLKDEAYFTLALVGNTNASHKISEAGITSDSIILVPERTSDRTAIRIQGYANCSMASVFYASDQTVPGTLFALSILSMATLLIWKRKETDIPETEYTTPSLDGIRLTPMQRQLVQMLLDAPDMRVDKSCLCESLWGNKSNAEESLYTLVKRTKIALAQANMEIVCNRGESYELRINS